MIPMPRHGSPRFLPLLLLMALALAWAGPLPAPESAVAWHPHDQGLRLAQERGLPLALYFFGKACRQCELLEQKVLARPEIAAYLNSRLVPVRISFDQENELVSRYRVVGPPTFYFMTPEAKPIDYLIGYVGPGKFSCVIHYIGEGKYQTTSYREFEKQCEEEK